MYVGVLYYTPKSLLALVGLTRIFVFDEYVIYVVYSYYSNDCLKSQQCFENNSKMLQTSIKELYMDNELLVKTIRTLCKDNNISVSQLESDLNFGAGLISRWTKSSPSLDKIIDIADYFHATLDEVVGRNINNNADNFINCLMQMTIDKEIQWKFIEEYESQSISNESYYDLFALWAGEGIEIYKCQFNDSYLFLVVQYELGQGLLENLDIQLYIQPDEESLPVLQEDSDENIEKLWIEIRKPYKGVPDEWKANTIRNQIMSQTNVNIYNPKNYTSNNDDEHKINNQLNTSEIQNAIQFLQSDSFKSVQKMLSNKEFMLAIENAQKIHNSISKTTEE